jgi:hypothetical protein
MYFLRFLHLEYNVDFCFWENAEGFPTHQQGPMEENFEMPQEYKKLSNKSNTHFP